MGQCPCHSKKSYEGCCQKFHEGELPQAPLQLMRSRYAAYALGFAGYIIHTTDPEGPMWSDDLETWEQEILLFSRETEFLGLEILEERGDTVTFKAKLKTGSEDTSFTEKSRFIQKDGKWLYHSGIIS